MHLDCIQIIVIHVHLHIDEVDSVLESHEGYKDGEAISDNEFNRMGIVTGKHSGDDILMVHFVDPLVEDSLVQKRMEGEEVEVMREHQKPEVNVTGCEGRQFSH